MLIGDRQEYRQKSTALSFPPETPVMDAVKAMATKNFGACAVIDGAGKLVGIFTERDLMRRVVAAGHDPSSTPLSAVMTKDVMVAKPTDDLRDWLRLMSNERFRHVPVQAEEGGPVVMMSQGDFVSYTWPELMHRVSEQTRASLGGRYYPIFIAVGVLVYTLLLLLFT
ncbi:MAG: CBS domain-containing protein [Parvularcula sp.]|jgi:CBS domain-containing protein|nr:CBS domain-containing protein [Parvularcula sp.]